MMLGEARKFYPDYSRPKPCADSITTSWFASPFEKGGMRGILLKILQQRAVRKKSPLAPLFQRGELLSVKELEQV
jgi:hypothetical protein